jgi:hypothetical protein
VLYNLCLISPCPPCSGSHTYLAILPLRTLQSLMPDGPGTDPACALPTWIDTGRGTPRRFAVSQSWHTPKVVSLLTPHALILPALMRSPIAST